MDSSIASLIDRRRSEFERFSDLPETLYASKSALWSNFFDRRENYLDEKTFEVFRTPEQAGSLGTGDHPESDEQAAVFFQCMAGVLGRYGFPHTIITDHEEPALGHPRQFPFGSSVASPTYLRLCVTAWRIAEAVERFGSSKQPLRICEIGAGFGLMSIILRRFLDVHTYTIIDLPENLYLSSIYSPNNLQNCTSLVLDPSERLALENEADLNFVAAPLTDQVELSFDLVVNIASLGEIPLSGANAYLSWIHQHLAPHGLFYSENRLTVPSKPEARRYTDFRFLEFALHEIGPVAGAYRPSNQIHIRQVLGKLPSVTTVSPVHYDAVSQLCAGGFGSALDGLCTDLVAGNLTAADATFLENIWALLTAETLDEKLLVLQRPAIAARPEFQVPLEFMIFSAFGQHKEAYQMKGRLFALETLDPALALRLFGHLAQLERGADLPGWAAALDYLDSFDRPHAQLLRAQLASGPNAHSFVARFKETVRPIG